MEGGVEKQRDISPEVEKGVQRQSDLSPELVQGIERQGVLSSEEEGPEAVVGSWTFRHREPFQEQELHALSRQYQQSAWGS